MVRYVSRKGSHPKAEDSLRFAALEMSEIPEQTEAADAQKPAQRGPGGHWPRKTIGLPGGVNALEQTAPAFAGRLGSFDQGHNGGSGASLVPGRQWRLGSHAAPDAVRTNSSTVVRAPVLNGPAGGIQPRHCARNAPLRRGH